MCINKLQKQGIQHFLSRNNIGSYFKAYISLDAFNRKKKFQITFEIQNLLKLT